MGLFNRLKKSLFGIKDEPEKKNENTDSVKDSAEVETKEDVLSEATKLEDESSESIKIEPESTELPEVEKTETEEPVVEPKEDEELEVEPTSSSPTELPEVEKVKTEEPVVEPKEDEELEVEPTSSLSTELPEVEKVKTEESIVEPKEEELEVESTESQSDNSEKLDEKYQLGLKKSRKGFAASFNRFLANFRSVDNEFFENLEDFLIESDVGYDLTMDLTDQLKEMVKLENLHTKSQIGQAIIQYLVDVYDVDEPEVSLKTDSELSVYLFVGVNGAGKTTTIGKLAARLIKEGKKVVLVAGDTFRAGATEQLDGWAKRSGAEIVKGATNQDPSSLVFDGIRKAKAENADYLLIDTAGRLQNKANLMNELDKIKRTINKEYGKPATETLLVIDATTGQNGLNQAKEFNKVTKVSGLVLSKLDGTAKGGIVLQIKKVLNIPVKLVGLGEQVGDLVDFNSEEFMRGFFSGVLKI